MEKTQEAFRTAALRQCEEAEKLGCGMKRLRGQIERYGAAETAKELLRRRRVSDGFDALAEKGRLDLSLEALVIRAQFGALFTDEEVNACFAELLDAGFRAW